MENNNPDKIVQNLLIQLKQLASENESLKLEKKSLQSSNSENTSSIIADFKNFSLLLSLAEAKTEITELRSKSLNQSISSKSSQLSFLKKLETKWLSLNKTKAILNNFLSNLSQASTKQRKLIQNLVYKSSASLYCENIQKLIDYTHAELKAKGVNIPETLENIDKTTKLEELKQKIRMLEADVSKKKKKMLKLEQGSDSSLEEFEEKLFSDLNNN